MAKSKKKHISKKKKQFEQEVIMLIIAVLLATICIIGLLESGIVGTFISNCIKFCVGELYGVVLGLGVFAGVYLIIKRNIPEISNKYVFSICLFLIAILLFCALPDDKNLVGWSVLTDFTANWKEILHGNLPANGGLIGNFLYAFISSLVARIGTSIVMIALIILGVVLIIEKSTWDSIFNSIKEAIKGSVEHKKQAPKKEVVKEEKVEKNNSFHMNWDQSQQDKKSTKSSTLITFDEYEEEPLYDLMENQEEVVPKKEKVIHPKENVVDKQDEVIIENNTTFEVDENDEKEYVLPKLALLDTKSVRSNSKANAMNAKEKGERVIEILKEFNIPCELVNISVGPSVTKFEIKPELGIRVSKIASLQDDIKMALAAKDIRIEAPIPGKSAVGIEIPNAESTVVKMHDMLVNVPSSLANKKLVVALGKDISGVPVYGELDKMPHLLVAGATGSGKSVCMNAIITSILMRAKPDEVKLVLVDPKRVEFTAYHGLPHLITPVINDAKEASKALKVVVEMMDGRYELFSETGVRNISTYNQKIKNGEFKDSRKPLPYIVVIIDELADLMMVASKDVENSIQRITQLARAAGIHLIVATQRPSVDVITGIIKANIPSRIAFAVSSAVDSRTILDQVGAEKLLGYGDMLYVPMGEPAPMRVQGAYVSDDEVFRITEHVKQQGKPHYDEAFRGPIQDESTNDINSKNDLDPMYEECKAFVIETQKASTSLLQRRFGLGYNRAARMIDLLEDHGIIGPNNGSKPREVYVKKNGEIDETGE